MPPNVPACLDQRAREFEEGKEKGDAPKGKESCSGRCLNPINRRRQMFDRIHSSTETNDTLFNPGSTGDADPGFAAPLPDAGALLAAAGLPSHAIREVLGSRTYTGADG